MLLLVDSGRPLNLSFTEVQNCSFVCPLVIGIAISCPWSLGFFRARNIFLTLRPLSCAPAPPLPAHTQCLKTIKVKKRQLILVSQYLWSNHFSPVLYAGWWENSRTVLSGKETCFMGHFCGFYSKVFLTYSNNQTCECLSRGEICS